MLTIACVWVAANVPYSDVYVSRLRAMVERHLDRPARFVCLTDRPASVPDGWEPVRIPNPSPLAGWWAKIQLFRPGLFDGRVLYLDLDTLVVNSLAPIIDHPSEFALVPHAGNFTPRNGLRVVRRFNSSVMVWDAGVNEALFTEWDPSVASIYFGDQDVIGERFPNADAMTADWFPRVSELVSTGDVVIPPSAKVVLVKKPKCVEASKRWPSFRKAWAA